MNPTDWIGRTESRHGAVTPVLAGMLGGALGHAAAGPMPMDEGAALPPLWHWVAFPEFLPLSELGGDGHPRLGRFLPPVPLERRMWAGGRLRFDGVFHVGEELRRRSEILSVEEKEGGTGRMVFVRVGHDVTGARGGRLTEEQDIVYLAMPDRFTPPRAIPLPEAPLFRETVPVGTERLFRFSAATWNAHRIHYDLDYARRVEKYPALIVHGPMQAMLLMEAAMRHTGRTPARFRFRGVHPMFHDSDLLLMGTAEDDAMRLCTGVAAGHQGMQADIEWGAA
jgi:3-methylfumaryl-CoA hydratase